MIVLVKFEQSNTTHMNKQRKHATLSARYTFSDIIGNSPSINEIKRIAELAAQTTSDILITGESGTGKELFAQAIHNASDCSGGPFVAINCAAVSKELLSSELFGYEGGAFTGAKKDGHPGKFEIANGGTLFLDEIGDFPYELQSFLLRVLEERSVTRLGSSKQIPLNIRIISATNQNLEHLVNQKKFRLDLYYRLNTIRIVPPPLRSRKSDIPVLINHFLKINSLHLNKNVTSISPPVMEKFLSYDWPGNVRELRNVIERGVIEAQNYTIETIQLPEKDVGLELPTQALYNEVPVETKVPFSSHLGDINTAYKELEAAEIRRLLILHKNNKTLVAEALGISRSTLYRRLHEL